MDFGELLRGRRSIREFERGFIGRGDIERMVELASLAPSATNDQPWRFIAVEDEDTKRKMRDIVEAKVEAYGEHHMKRYALHFSEAPFVIVVLYRPWMGKEDPWAVELGIESASVACAYLELAARDMGYGTCWCSSPLFYAREELEALLGVEKPWRILALFPVGKPRKIPKNPGRKPLGEILSFL